MRRGSYARPGLLSVFLLCGGAAAAPAHIMRLREAQTSQRAHLTRRQLLSSATVHRPHSPVRGSGTSFNAGHVTVSTDDHALCQLQVQVISQISLRNIDLKRKQLFTQFRVMDSIRLILHQLGQLGAISNLIAAEIRPPR
jgi:hypothetical protein